MEYKQYCQWMQQQAYYNHQYLITVQNNCSAQLSALKLQLNRTIEIKNTQVHLLRTAKQKESNLCAENQKLLDENKMLTESLEATKAELAELKTHQQYQPTSVLHGKNALHEDNCKELVIFKEKFLLLDEERCQLKLKLENLVGKIDALNAVNEMLLKGNEKRDETIAKHKKLLQNYVKLRSSSDSESQTENFSSPCRSIASEPLKLKQKRGFGSKALHALSLLGAENTSGPWLCLRCGDIDSAINFTSYAEFRQHLIHAHKENIDSALCEHCGWRSNSDRELDFHKYKMHQIESLFYTFAKTAILDKCEQV